MDNLLSIKNVSKKYPKFELKDVSFDIPEGAIVGFIGRNGAGKTTTLKGIMNLLHFDSGEVYAFGKNIRESELEAKQDIGFTLSELSYYPNKTIRQVISVTKRFYKNFDENRYEKLCKLFDLDLDKKIQELSSGMKVKYSLAIALSYNAKLLILDEPTSGLDPISRDEIVDIFKNIIKGKERSVLFSTHITSDLDKCATHIVYIHNGEIIYKGTKADFLSKYLIISAKNLQITDKIEELCISYKESEDSFEGLILSENKSHFENEEISFKEPDLEEIMVYVERGKDNETFDL